MLWNTEMQNDVQYKYYMQAKSYFGQLVSFTQGKCAATQIARCEPSAIFFLPCSIAPE